MTDETETTPEQDQVARKLRRVDALLKQLDGWDEATSSASTPPWKAAPMEQVGKDWTVGSFGHDGTDDWLVVVSGAEVADFKGDPESDARFVAAARRAMPTLLRIARKHLLAAQGELEAKSLELLNI